MKIDVDEHGAIVLSEVYNGIGIKTPAGTFGICQRDGGLVVTLNGVHVYDHEYEGEPGHAYTGE